MSTVSAKKSQEIISQEKNLVFPESVENFLKTAKEKSSFVDDSSNKTPNFINRLWNKTVNSLIGHKINLQISSNDLKKKKYQSHRSIAEKNCEFHLLVTEKKLWISSIDCGEKKKHINFVKLSRSKTANLIQCSWIKTMNLIKQVTKKKKKRELFAEKKNEFC